MSFNVRNGIKFKEKDLNKLFHSLKSLRKIIKTSAQNKQAELLAIISTRLLDMTSIDPTKSVKSPLNTAVTMLMQRQQGLSVENKRDPEVDLFCEIVLIPQEDCTLGLVYTDQTSFMELILNTEGIESYDYWAEGAPPLNVVQFDWELRKTRWTSAFPNKETPLDVGLVLKLSGHTQYPPPVETILNYIPSLEDRAEKLVIDFALETLIQGLVNQLQHTKPEHEVREEINKAIKEFMAGLPNNQEIQSKISELKNNLIENITANTLIGEV